MNKKYLAIPLVIFVALGMTGFTYATWYKWLHINGTVDTGELCWEFVEGSLFSKDQGNDWTCDAYTMRNIRQLTKDVGSTEGHFADLDEDGCLETLFLNLTNVYPCYYNEISIRVVNCGTIPLHIAQPVLYFDGIEYALPEFQVLTIHDQNGREIFEIRWGDNTGAQLHPWIEEPEISFEIHILQEAEKGATYNFEIKMLAIQWNAQPGEQILS
jgi:hypothetical protein